jgi:Fe-S cluster assembly protein SufD
MTVAMLNPDLLKEAQATLPADGLRAVRESALPAFLDHGLPSTRDEDWRYTNLGTAGELGQQWLHDLVSGAGEKPVSATPLPALDAHCLLLRNGTVDTTSLAAVSRATSAQLTLARLSDRADSIVAAGPLDALNAALLQDGLHIAVKAGQKPDKPLVIFIDDGGRAASQTRVVIDVAKDASIDVVEYHLAGNATPHFANTVTQVELASGARANIVRLQDRDRSHVQVGKLAAKLQAAATLDYVSFDIGGKLVRHDVTADILGADAVVRMHGLYLASDQQHIDIHTRVDHRVGPAASREEYRGILNGKSRCVFNGKAIVHAGADGTDAEQANHNLLLSDKAEVDTKPELEIYADDVKCSHGATVGQLDKAALFYMQSRGLDRDAAAHLLTRAFAGQILNYLPFAAMRDHIEARIDSKLDELLEEHTQ